MTMDIINKYYDLFKEMTRLDSTVWQVGENKVPLVSSGSWSAMG